MAYKGFLMKLIFLLHLMGVSHLRSSALTDSWHLMGEGTGVGRGVCSTAQSGEYLSL